MVKPGALRSVDTFCAPKPDEEEYEPGAGVGRPDAVSKRLPVPNLGAPCERRVLMGCLPMEAGTSYCGPGTSLPLFFALSAAVVNWCRNAQPNATVAVSEGVDVALETVTHARRAWFSP